MGKFGWGAHFCHTPRKASNGQTFTCPRCGAGYKWKESVRRDAYGRETKKGSWLQFRNGNA